MEQQIDTTEKTSPRGATSDLSAWLGNREIKFRAWLKEPEILVDVLLIDWETKQVLHEDLSIPNTAALEPPDPDRVTNLDDCILMQYTGLKDKNGKGKEIYHKDIFTKGGIVEWIIDAWFVKFSTYKIRLSTYLQNDSTRETIGNIFENPELLPEVA